MDSRTAAAPGTTFRPDAISDAPPVSAAPGIERLLADHPTSFAALRDALIEASRDGVEHVHVEPVGPATNGRPEGGWRLRRRHDDGLEELRLGADAALPHALARLADHGRTFTIRLTEGPRLLALRVLPALCGDVFLLTLLDGSLAPPALDALGLDAADLRRVRDVLRGRTGWLAVGTAGPLDGARVVRALAQEIVSPERAIVCLDRPPHAPLAGVAQLDASASTGIDVALDADAVLLASDPPASTELLAHLASRATGDFLVVRASLARRPSDVFRELAALGRPDAWLALAVPALLMRHRVRLLCHGCRVRASHDDADSHRLGLRVAPRVHDVATWLEQSFAVRYRAGEGCERCHGLAHRGVRDLTTIVTPDEAVHRTLRAGDLDAACDRLDRANDLAKRLGDLVATGEICASEADRHLAPRY